MAYKATIRLLKRKLCLYLSELRQIRTLHITYERTLSFPTYSW